MFLIGFLFIQIVSTQVINKTHDVSGALIDVVYWEVKPFIFTNEYGELDGILPRILEEGQFYCGKHANVTTNIYKFSLKMNSRKEFYNLLRSNISYGEGLLQNISKGTAFWAPSLANKYGDDGAFKHRRGFLPYRLVKTSHIALIVPRSYIFLPTKIFRGILSCTQIIFLTCLLSALLSMVIWFIERGKNNKIDESFYKGVGTTLWWTLVSMTTVGYGDVVPKSIISRALAIIWIFTGVLIACVMTATMTDEVSGIGGLHLKGLKVSVLENSYEANVAVNDYDVIPSPASSYEEVIEMARTGKTFAAMMNSDIASWYQSQINNASTPNPLVIIKELPANLYIDSYVTVDIGAQLEKVFKCMYLQKEEVYKASIEHFRRHCKTDVLYIGSMKEFLKEQIFIQLLLYIIFGLVCLGVTYDLVRYKQASFKKKMKKKNTGEDMMLQNY